MTLRALASLMPDKVKRKPFIYKTFLAFPLLEGPP
jgi:hypothetical protein